jgi:ribonuclease HII
MLVAGVDEAGRGCVIGPLVVAGVAIAKENLKAIADFGVKDSKLLTPKKREVLYSRIIEMAQSFHVIKLQPSQIDLVVRRARKLHKLNRLEAETMAKVIEELRPDEAYVDAADVLERRFAHHIKERLTLDTIVISQHKADRIYPIVSAASIIAKVERDRDVGNLRVNYGDFGSGYLTDKKTLCFLRKFLEDNGDYPDCVRQSWKPAIKVKSELNCTQRTLT